MHSVSVYLFPQLVKSGKFQMYDYGSANRNMQHYKQRTPPSYHVERMSTDVVLFWAQNDWLADPQVSQILHCSFLIQEK